MATPSHHDLMEMDIPLFLSVLDRYPSKDEGNLSFANALSKALTRSK